MLWCHLGDGGAVRANEVLLLRLRLLVAPVLPEDALDVAASCVALTGVALREDADPETLLGQGRASAALEVHAATRRRLNGELVRPGLITRDRSQFMH